MLSLRLANFVNDPFAITTISFAVVSWIVAIAGACASDQSKFPPFTWWGLVYQILVTAAVLILYLNNNIELYKFLLVGLISIAFIYSTNSTNSLIYTSHLTGNSCCAAGCILLSIVNLVWIFYLGGHPELPTNQFIDSLAFRLRVPQPDVPENAPHEKYPSFRDSSMRPPVHPDGLNGASRSTGYVSSSQLAGLENLSSPEVNILANNPAATASPVPNPVNPAAPGLAHLKLTPLFKYRAQALYLYQANPDDANEISFDKNEILEIEDISGKWWQARRANGDRGICPLNYVTLLDQ